MDRRRALTIIRNGLPWLALLVILIGSLWAITQRREAPQLIMLGLLVTLTFNFSLPLSRGAVGLVPMVAVASFLIVGLETAVSLMAISFILAELIYPLWRSTWQQTERPSWLQRLLAAAIFIIATAIAANVYTSFNGSLPIRVSNLNLSAIMGLGVSYGLAYWLLVVAYWVISRQSIRARLREDSLSVLAIGTLSQPFAILAAIIFSSGLPGFVIFATGVILFSVIIWLSWQQRTTLAERLDQVARLNQVALSLRETLNLDEVLALLTSQLSAFIPADATAVFLQNADETWTSFPQTAVPDDFARWVVANGRLLDIYPGNLHFAQRHQLSIPQPAPHAWLGIPLSASGAGGTFGVIVLQRWQEPAFSRWQRELLVASAAQASAAIQNARRFGETERLYSQTDAALAERVQQLQALLNAMKDGVLLLDVNGRILLANLFAAALLQQKPDMLPNQPVVAPELLGFHPTSWQHLLTDLAQGNLPPAEPQLYQYPSAAKPRHIARQETAVTTARGSLIGWLMLFRDVTEEMELAEKRTDLTRMIVHDLRNPLTTITSTLQLALRHLPQEAPHARSLLDHAQATTTDMLDMVDSLMDINRMEAGQLVIDAEAMHLPPLVNRVVDRLRPLAATQQITIHTTIPDHLPPVWADIEIIRRILVNLLDNAIKFTPGDGIVTLTMQPEDAQPGWDPGVRCIVTDSGPGIPAEARNAVFDRYMRTNVGGAQIRGTGLGLTFCKLAVMAHNGRIWVDDAPSGGSQFIFTLPGIPHFETMTE